MKNGKGEVMFCRKCGNQISDDAKFCTACGQPTIRQGSQIKTSAKSVKKSDYAVLAVMGIIIVFLISRIGSLTKAGNDNLAKADNGIFTGGKNGDTDEVYENGSLNFEPIISQCEYCEAPLITLVDLCDLGTAYGYDEDKLNACSIKKHSEMQHNCTAEVIQVENLPYVYRCCYGFYSGEWQGAGPTGTGTFVGESHLEGDLISYTGDWKYGLPEGEGELYIQNFHARDMKYKGQMSAGLRHGTGYMYEYAPGFSGFYRIYDQTVFENDIMAIETQAEDYDLDTGEVIRYLTLIGGENGDVYSTATWNAGELSPKEKQLRDAAAAAIVVGTLGYMIYSTVDGYEKGVQEVSANLEKRNQEMLADLERYRAQEQEELLEQQAREAEAEKTRRWNEDKYYESLKNDPDEYLLDTKKYKYNAGLGY